MERVNLLLGPNSKCSLLINSPLSVLTCGTKRVKQTGSLLSYVQEFSMVLSSLPQDG